MPDTIRSLAELDALFADNSVAAITPQDVRDLMVSQMVHGEIGSGAKASITLGTGYQPVVLDVPGAVGRGLTVDTANRRLADVPVPMKAMVYAEVYFRGQQNRDYTIAVWKNTHDLPNAQRVDRLTRPARILSAAQIGVVVMSTSMQLQAGDSLQLGVQSDGSTFELLFGVLRVQRIGVE